MRRTLVLVALLSACASTGSAQQERNAPTVIETRAISGGDRFRVITEGLDRELAIEGVSEDDLPYARAVLEATLAALPEGETPKAGTTAELRFGKVSHRVQLVSTAGAPLLVIDLPPDGNGVSPRHAMATAALAKALSAHDEGEMNAARNLALASVRLHPGDPLEAATDERAGEQNAQNHLAWALLAQINDGAEAERWYVGALERSPDYMAAQLGARPEQLLEADHAQVTEAARAIVRARIAAAVDQKQPAGARGPVEFPSPIVTHPPQRALLPREFLGLYAAEPAASLIQDDAWLALAVEAFERLRTDPVELLLATRDIRSIYLQESLFAPPPSDDRPIDKMLSALIADVARKAAAGLTQYETAATLGAEADPQTLASARAKLREQRDVETAWYAAALQ